MRNMKLAILPSTFLAVAAMLGGCVGVEPDKAADGWTTDIELEAEAASVLEQPGLAADYNGVCGSGYNVIDSGTLTGGTVYLTYNSSDGNNCVVTIRDTPGEPLPMCAGLTLATTPDWGDPDCGDYTTYAGPVYVHAPGQCIDWMGSIGDSSFEQYDSHCD